VPVFKKIPRLVGRLGSGPRFVGRLRSGVWVSAIFQKNTPPRGSERDLGSGPRLVCRLASGVELVPVFKTIPRLIGRLGLGSCLG